MHHKLIENKNAINIVSYTHHKKQRSSKSFQSSSSLPNISVPSYINRFVDIPNPKMSHNYDLNEPRIRNEAPISTSEGSDSFHTIGDPTPRDVYETSNLNPKDIYFDDGDSSLLSPQVQQYLMNNHDGDNDSEDLKAHLQQYALLPPSGKKYGISGGGIAKSSNKEFNAGQESQKPALKSRRTKAEMVVHLEQEKLKKREKAIEKAHNNIIKLKSKVDEAKQKYIKYIDKSDLNSWKQKSHKTWINLQKELQDAEDHLEVLQKAEK